MRLDPQKREVRAVDQEWTVEWRAGIPALSLLAEAFRGQKVSIEFGTAYAFTEQGGFGQVYKYKFATSRIKKPLQEAVAASGWTWRGAVLRQL